VANRLLLVHSLRLRLYAGCFSDSDAVGAHCSLRTKSSKLLVTIALSIILAQPRVSGNRATSCLSRCQLCVKP